MEQAQLRGPNSKSGGDRGPHKSSGLGGQHFSHWQFQATVDGDVHTKQYQMSWKESSLNFLVCGNDAIGNNRDGCHGNTQQEVSYCHEKFLAMETFVVKLDSTMSTLNAGNRRPGKCFSKTFNFTGVKGIGLFPKMKRYAERVQPCFLHGAGGWAWNKQIYTKLEQTENNFFRQMAGRSKKKNEM